jgi:DNA-binding LacI/PurR family transcriptional regulator
MTTIRDIAHAAGVSVGTVSNFLNDPQLVAEDTHEKIRAAIERLDYHPRAAARSLKSRQTRRIGLVPIISPSDNRSEDPGDNAFLELLAGLNTLAAESSYDLLIAAATDRTQEIKTYKRLIGEAQVDGLILTGIRTQDERLQYLSESNFPFVAYGRADSAADYAYVDVDGAAGIEEAISYLAGLGHQYIAYITPPEGLMCTRQRWEGYLRGMQSNHLAVRTEYVMEGGFNERSGQMYTHLLMDLPQPPTAILTANDICAFGAMRALQMRGYQVGGDVSVIGFDDISLANHWQPSLSTISQPFRKIGFSLMQSLFAILSGEERLPQVLLKPTLVVRQSTGAMKGG